MDRRDFLRTGAAIFGGGSLLLSASRSVGLNEDRGYGPLSATADLETGLHLLKVPEGFQYRTFGWTGEEMDDGTPTPDRHDGMGVVRALNDRGTSFVLMRNHERGFVGRVGSSDTPSYDDYQDGPLVPGMGGGTTALIFRDGQLSGVVPTLAGTLVNCAGGVTPWGSWLTCEEIIVRGESVGARDHGYVFEVPSPDLGASTAVPIVDMGLMKHEAVALDPRSGYVYLTEDNGPSGIYRFRPNDPGQRLGALERGGRLEMLKVKGLDNADLGSAPQSATYDIEWVTIPEPDADPERLTTPRFGLAQTLSIGGLPDIFGAGKSGPYMQGEAGGAASFRRPEGCWYDAGRVFFTDTTGGAGRFGNLWSLELSSGGDADRLECVFSSPGELYADRLDNVCVSPNGGVVLCEDGRGQRGPEGFVHGNRLIGLSQEGVAFPLVESNAIIDTTVPGRPWISARDYRDQEFAGACFSPTGDVLFGNIQTPGITFAISGPWQRGPL